MTTFVIAYDSAQMAPVKQQLDAFVASNKLIDTWSKPFEGMYLVRTSADRLTIFNTFKTFFPSSAPFFMTQTDVNQAAGIIQNNIWQWFNETDYTSLFAPQG